MGAGRGSDHADRFRPSCAGLRVRERRGVPARRRERRHGSADCAELYLWGRRDRLHGDRRVHLARLLCGRRVHPLHRCDEGCLVVQHGCFRRSARGHGREQNLFACRWVSQERRHEPIRWRCDVGREVVQRIRHDRNDCGTDLLVLQMELHPHIRRCGDDGSHLHHGGRENLYLFKVRRHLHRSHRGAWARMGFAGKRGLHRQLHHPRLFSLRRHGRKNL